MSNKNKKRTDNQLIRTISTSIITAKEAHQRLMVQNPAAATYISLSLAEIFLGTLGKEIKDFRNEFFDIDGDGSANEDQE